MPLLPSRRLALAIALAGTAFLIGTTPAFVVNTLLLLIVVADGIAVYRIPLPRIERSVPDRISLGDTTDVALDVRNDAAVTRRLLWTTDPGPGLEYAATDVLAADIPAGAAIRQNARLHARERGRTQLGDLHVRILSPLGLFWRRRRLRRADPILVQPGLRELRRYRLLAKQHRLDPGVKRTREVGEGREFERLREYVRGDDPRRMDWKATARRNIHIVRQYEAERSQSIIIAIDAGRIMGERFDGRERLDHALAAGLVIADAATVHGDSTGILVFADTIQAFLPPARNSLSRIADALANVETRRLEPDYPAAFHYLSRRVRRRSLVMLFTDVIDARASSVLLDHMAALARRHLPMIVALRNIELEAAAAAHASDDRAAFHRAAAEELLQARAVALNAVRRRGVLIADVRPEAATAEALSRYLEVKRRSLL